MTKWFLNKLPTKALIKSRLKGDLKECSGVLVEPDDGVQIQVVGGLIQHQQSGLHKQGPGKQIHQLQYNTPHHCCDMGQLTFFTHTHTPCKGHSHSPAPGEFLGGPVLHLGGEGQTSQDPAGSGLCRCCSDGPQLFVDLEVTQCQCMCWEHKDWTTGSGHYWALLDRTMTDHLSHPLFWIHFSFHYNWRLNCRQN